ncbi:MAG: hypothetical protein HYU28_00335 [Actinobacteria bacterium]|nr:hypothetical protein [Actinomycetota bacterium]
MNRSLLLALAVTLFVASPLVLSVEPARASCAPGTPDFDLAFEGVAVEGPEDPSTGQLLSPARFNVEEWIEGEGPSRVEVVTATQVEGDLIRSDSVGITPKAGEARHGDHDRAARRPGARHRHAR